MRGLAIMAGATLLGVGASAALTPLPLECHGHLLAAEEAAWGEYAPRGAAGGLAIYSGWQEQGEVDVMRLVVEHCASGNRSEAEFRFPQQTETAWAQVDAYQLWLDEALVSTQVYTLADLANQVVAMGGQGRTTQVGYQSCACRVRGGQ